MTLECLLAGPPSLPGTCFNSRCVSRSAFARQAEEAVELLQVQQDVHDEQRSEAARGPPSWLVSVPLRGVRQGFLWHEQPAWPHGHTHRHQAVQVSRVSGGVQLRLSVEETHPKVSRRQLRVSMMFVFIYWHRYH